MQITSASGEQDLAQKSHSAIHKINFINKIKFKIYILLF